jgi:hypothetical protein
VADDAGHRDGRAGRLDQVADGAQGPRGRAAAGVPAPGPGLEDRVCGWGGGPGDLWFPDITLPVGFGQTRTATRLPVLVMVTGYARWLAARLLPSRAAEDLFAGWWQLLQGLGAVPRVLVWDGEGAIGRRRRR